MKSRVRMQLRHRPLFRAKTRSAIRYRIVTYALIFVLVSVPAFTFFNLGTPERVYAGTMQAVGSGNWTAAATWSKGRVPTDNDTITIPAGITVTVDIVTASYSHLLIIVNGTLYFNGGKKIIMCEGM